jgi:hypothetical protein
MGAIFNMIVLTTQEYIIAFVPSGVRERLSFCRMYATGSSLSGLKGYPLLEVVGSAFLLRWKYDYDS